ncbi:hypothetical protein ACFC8N_17010 [Streptomyces sp. NPDC055966]|uniref:hypothetical protein n=1 Tax=Streptomyces sp. NPDC055966 TaxID=3345669 RepID=UPI0035E379AB
MLISFELRHLEDQPVAVRLCGPHPDAGANPRIRSNPYTISMDATTPQPVQGQQLDQAAEEAGAEGSRPGSRIVSTPYRRALADRYRIALDLGVGWGLRQGEVFGFSPGDVQGDFVHVER